MIITLLMAFFMCIVLYMDTTRYLIPNWLVGLVLLLYPVQLYFSPESIDWQSGLIAAGIAFAIGFLLFNFSVMGGGDVKLLAACFLWVAPSATIEYLLYVGIIGGVLTLLLLLSRPIVPFYIEKFGGEGRDVPRLFTQGEPVPYGVAIAGAFLILLYQGAIVGLPSPL